MKELYNLDLSENTIKTMYEINPNIKDLTDLDIIKKIELLRQIGCKDNEIRNIISSNSIYLTSEDNDILSLIITLKKLGFTCINILLDSNPYILNLNPFEIKNYIDNRIKNGENLEDVVDNLESEPYLFNEF
jgi:hypothetical protein